MRYTERDIARLLEVLEVRRTLAESELGACRSQMARITEEIDALRPHWRCCGQPDAPGRRNLAEYTQLASSQIAAHNRELLDLRQKSSALEKRYAVAVARLRVIEAMRAGKG